MKRIPFIIYTQKNKVINAKVKNFLIGAVILFVAVITSGVVFRNTSAQNKYGYDCPKEYQTTQLACLDDMKTCTAQCDEAYPHDPEGAAARCKSICDTDRNSCDTLAADWYRECLGLNASGQELPVVDIDAQSVLPNVPDPTPTVPPSQTETPTPTVTPKPLEQPQDEIIEIDPDKIAGFKTQVLEEAKKIIDIKKCPGSPLPSENPCVAEKLDFILVQPAESYLQTSFLDKQEKKEPIILDNSEKREIVGFQESFLHTPSMDLTKLHETLDLHESTLKDSEKSFSKPTPRPEFQSPIARAADGSEFSLILVGENAPEWQSIRPETKLSSPSVIATGEKPVQIITPDKTTVELKGVFRILPKESAIQDNALTWEILGGEVHVDKSDDGETIKVQTPLTKTKSKHTKFSVLYNPEELYAATVVYEGEVEVTDILNGSVTTLTPTEDGRPRVLVVPLEEIVAVVTAQKSNTVWIAVFMLLLVAIGYLLYFKKDAILQSLKKN